MSMATGATMTDGIYLDHNATSPLRPEARTAMVAALDAAGNASSIHRFGRAARRRIEDAREVVAALVNVAPARVVFTAGATEANNWVLTGTQRAGRRILASAVEHDSVLAVAPVEQVPVDRNGVLRLDALEAMLAADGRPALVSVMAANNETGVLQPVAEAAAVARRHGDLLQCDAVPRAGKAPLDVDALDADSDSLSAHTLGGPQGVGALILRDGVPLAPRLVGGGPERRRRAGTENVPGIAGFGAAARAALNGLEDYAGLAVLRDRLEARIAEGCPDALVFGAAVPRLANTSCLTMPGVAAETQLMAFDLAGIAVSAGSACSSGKVAESHVLRAMGVEPALAATAIRVSLGWNSTERDVEAFADAWIAMRRRDDASAAA